MFHETIMGRRFFEDTMPRLVHELETLNKNLTPKKYEYDIAEAGQLATYLDDGWKPKFAYTDLGLTFIVVEREKDA